MRTVEPALWPRKGARGVPSSPPPGLESRLRGSLGDAALEYWRHCSVPGVARLSRGTLSNIERCEQGVLLVACLCWGAGVACLLVLQQVAAPPQQVNQLSSRHSVRYEPFPAVALCSPAPIYTQPLDNYTAFIKSRVRGNKWSERTIRDHLVQFGALQALALPAAENVAFSQLLARADPQLDVAALMRAFSSPCDDMLRSCSWRGHYLPCEALFSTRLTPLGFCCVFNSRYDPADVNRPPYYLNMVGQDYGLTAIVYENPEHFAYVRRASVGADVLIFDGSEYPILEGGGVRMYPAEQNTSVFLSVSVTSQRPDDAGVPGCSPAARSRYAWCLTECRRRTLAALCGCQLHTLPPHPDPRLPTCSLADLPCLNKHREKLIYYYPGESQHTAAALEEEAQNGQDCAECKPDCTRRLYSATVSVSRYHHPLQHKIFRRRITEGKSMVNTTVVRLFYSSEHQRLLSVESHSRWFEFFAKVGSAWSGITGASVAAASELCFYLTVRWAHHYARRWAEARRPRRTRPRQRPLVTSLARV